MEQIIRAADRHTRDFGWLTARWHFSFGDYFDPKNVSFGALRVFNDDLIRPGGEFPLHPHRDMEIISYVVEGALQHKDSTGGEGVLRPGEVQVMSAGKGIVHSEGNPSVDTTTRLLQIWLEPRHRGLAPRYDQRSFADVLEQGKLVPLVSAGDVAGTLRIDQDATLSAGHLAKGNRTQHVNERGEQTYLFVIDGAVQLDGTVLHGGDQARLTAQSTVAFEAAEDSHVVVIDLA